MKKILLLAFLISVKITVFSQARVLGNIKGKVFDIEKKLPLADATITLVNKSDSVAVAYSVADKEGAFELKNIDSGSFILSISNIGFSEFTKNLTITPTVFIIDLGTINLVTDTSTVMNVIVKAPSIIIKKDTVEFKASAFKTKPNANVEDLLKKLPGVEVDKDGNITSQGEEITRVYVDGKEFFTNDPKLATKNLTAELVESIQVFDDMSDRAKFTKMDDGSRTRTINIKLKKDRKKGIFGRSDLAIGTKDRYAGNASFSVFNNKTQVSVLAGANNVNKLGYTSNDLIGNMGGMAGFSGGNRGGGGGGNRGGGGGNRGGGGNAGNGNTASWNGGVNFRDNWGTKLQVAGNYFVSKSVVTNRSNSLRQSFFPNDSVTYTSNDSYDKNSSLNNSLNFRMEYTIDSMNSILITPTLSWQNSESLSFDSVLTTAGVAGNKIKAITSIRSRTNERNGYNLGNNLLYRHKFKKPGRTFTIGWNTGYNNSEGEGYNESPYTYFNKDGSVNYIRNQHQRNDQATSSFNNTISTSFTEMLAVGKVLELNYAYSNNQSTSDRKTFDFNTGTGKYDSVNKQQTNYFENGFVSSRIGANYRVKKEKYDYQLGGAIQLASLENMSHRALTGKDSLMKQNYTNFFPNASFNYNLGTRKSIRFGYRGSTRAPGITQLQDVVDVSNPLNYRSGNPDLKQEFNNNFNFSYNTFNVSNFMYFNATVTAGNISNRIVNSTDTLNRFVLITKPVNVSGAWNFSFNGTVGIPLKKVATGKKSPMNLNLTTTYRYNRDVSMLYKQTLYNYNSTISQRINFNYNVNDKFDLGTSARLSYNNAKYSVNSNLNNKFFSSTYSVDMTYTVVKDYVISTDFDYLFNTGRSDGFNQSIPLWNASIGKYLFKKKNAEVRLSVVDLLNQNKSIGRNIGDNYFEDTYTQVLSRYFMLTFSLNLNKFGGKAPGNNGGGMRGQGGGNRGGGGGGRMGGGQ
jgi:Outer membrane protein beta-barrel family/Carboxypeptidase regulatory-like domain